MRLHRFIEKFKHEGAYSITDPLRINQITKVLRLAVGDIIILADGTGNEAQATIAHIEKKEIALVIGPIEKREETGREVVLYCSILKRENFEFVAQKATELGVNTIVPMLTKRTVKQAINHERLVKIIEEAAEQSGRATIPILEKTLHFEKAIEDAQFRGTIIFLEQHIQSSPEVPPGCLCIFVGPEGGWSDEEKEMVAKNNPYYLSLGDTTLRGETAAMVGVFAAKQI